MRAEIGSAPLLTPEKYLSLESTDLRFTVPPGENTIDIQLTSEGEAKTETSTAPASPLPRTVLIAKLRVAPA